MSTPTPSDVTALLLAWGRRSQAGLLAATLLAGLLAQVVLKALLSRPRPPAAFALIKLPASASFPSGHALMSLLFAGVIVFVLWRALPGVRERMATVSVAALIVLAVGLSRVYLGAHWPSDVIASWSLGMAILVLAAIGELRTTAAELDPRKYSWMRLRPKQLPSSRAPDIQLDSL